MTKTRKNNRSRNRSMRQRGGKKTRKYNKQRKQRKTRRNHNRFGGGETAPSSSTTTKVTQEGVKIKDLTERERRKARGVTSAKVISQGMLTLMAAGTVGFLSPMVAAFIMFIAGVKIRYGTIENHIQKMQDIEEYESNLTNMLKNYEEIVNNKSDDKQHKFEVVRDKGNALGLGARDKFGNSDIALVDAAGQYRLELSGNLYSFSKDEKKKYPPDGLTIEEAYNEILYYMSKVGVNKSIIKKFISENESIIEKFKSENDSSSPSQGEARGGGEDINKKPSLKKKFKAVGLAAIAVTTLKALKEEANKEREAANKEFLDVIAKDAEIPTDKVEGIEKQIAECIEKSAKTLQSIPEERQQQVADEAGTPQETE